MKIQKIFFFKGIIILNSLGTLLGCGVTSNSSATGSGPGKGSSFSVQSMSPGEIARMQNQKIASLTPQNFDEEIQKMDDSDAVKTLYSSLSNPNSTIRKKSEEMLATLVTYDDRYLDELRRLQTENRNPDSWYSVSLILKDADKAKAKAKEAELKEMMRE